MHDSVVAAWGTAADRQELVEQMSHRDESRWLSGYLATDVYRDRCARARQWLGYQGDTAPALSDIGDDQ